jgi:hypothetical protein
VFEEESRAAAVIPLNVRWAIVASFPSVAVPGIEPRADEPVMSAG